MDSYPLECMGQTFDNSFDIAKIVGGFDEHLARRASRGLNVAFRDR